jgi:uncharacterized protein (DUF2147 family)
MKFYRTLALALAAGLGAGVAADAAAGDPSGLWLTAGGDAKIQVSRCGRAVCGRVVWLRNPVDNATGQRIVDAKNPNPSKRVRPMIGLRLFGMTPAGPDKWAGPIYNADDGQTYSGNLTLKAPDRLAIGGCVGPFCGSETWTKTK